MSTSERFLTYSKEKAMAQRVVTELTDDLDGTSIERGAGETVRFGLDGVEYEIDLKKSNASRMRSQFERYIAAGRRAGKPSNGRSRAKPRGDGPSPQAVPTWAANNGIEVSGRGRIPADILRRYTEVN
jgi:nucleoid-associated protein Lsr2